MVATRRILVIALSACAALMLAAPLAADPIDDFVRRHFDHPVAGDVSGWIEPAGRLTPDGCGVCHVQQRADWAGSRHARAVGPGLLAQIGPEGDGGACTRCHAPLAEQQRGTPHYRPELEQHGLYCAGCHVRNGTMWGPRPRRATAQQAAQSTHNGFRVSVAFSDSRFCGACHQFAEDGFRLNGKLLEDTVNEWRASPAGKAGKPCQSCHMPDRRHLWRGIHDPEMTAGALQTALERTGPRSALYRVTATNVGHRLPTYVTPRLTVRLVALDPSGQPVTSTTYAIQRRVDVWLQQELYDTRLKPGETATVSLTWRDADAVTAVVGSVLVEPDEYYERFFSAYTAESRAQRTQAAAALAEYRKSAYTVHRRWLKY
ncbi:MAG: hypothetical protein D6761_12860 [Candidatus Dadabacteria bacterium]|nr:MAG: hypothetical protein D6761_12860 [Candidatus Dadabacteria bacterium]